MATNSAVRRVAQKELRLFSASPVAWLFLATFASVCLFIFFWVESFFARNIADLRPLFEWMPILLIFLCSALTMRMWSEERRTGTLEHVLTQPVGLWRFVIGKFLACLSLLLLALLCTTPLPISIALIADLDWGPVGAGYLATIGLGAGYISAGLFISARTDNPIVSLLGSAALCTVLYLLGSSTITDFFDNDSGHILRLLGSGSRFDSITRGVIDLRDLAYYLSLVIIFLTLNIYVLEKERWARVVSTSRHRLWGLAVVLVIANVVLSNLWLARFSQLRLDVTEGQLYSISLPTQEFLEQLEEPLLIRGYFSAKTHPMLSPLIPQLRDLMKEYEVAGKGKVRVEFIDPADDADMEREANDKFAIHSTPFQVADRYQSALVNSYFSVLLQYGSEHETLGFADLIEVKTGVNQAAEVRLRNPEYDLTRAIRDVLYSYQVGGNLFDGIDGAVEFIAYVSDEALLPPQLVDYKQSIYSELQTLAEQSGGQFTLRFLEPEAQGGRLARQIADEWGFKPMVTALASEQEFFFYLTLANDHQVVQLPTDNFDPAAFRPMLDAGLKRFASGFTRTVALVTPPVDEQMARFNIGAPTFSNLEQAITRDYSILLEDLTDGSVAPEADILVVVAPYNLRPAEVYAIDQYLMRGGTIILATAPYSIEISAGNLRMQDWQSGLNTWLAHHGIELERTLVVDERNASFPAPVKRQSGGHEFQDVQIIDYPFFLDVRSDGLAQAHPVTRDLPQVTMAWASPIRVERRDAIRPSYLLRSSNRSQIAGPEAVAPGSHSAQLDEFDAQGPRQARTVGVALQGRFRSYFEDREVPLDDLSDAQAQPPALRNTVVRSPESARIVLYA